MKLKNIGFYTLSDQRAKESNINTPLHRCELIVTDRCSTYKTSFPVNGLNDKVIIGSVYTNGYFISTSVIELRN